MKLFKFIFLAIFISTFVACNSDDNATTPENSIVGEWTVTEIFYEGNTTTSVQGQQPVSGTFTGTGFDMDLKIDFAADPNDYTTSGNYSINLETIFAGQTFPSTWVNNEFQGSGSWTKDGSIMVFTSEAGEVSEAEIMEETSTLLMFKQNYNNVDVQNGATITHNIEATFTFEK